MDTVYFVHKGEQAQEKKEEEMRPINQIGRYALPYPTVYMSPTSESDPSTSWLPLLDSNFLAASLLGLGHSDIEETVLELGLDLVLIDGGREAEDAGELAIGPLTEPVPGLWLFCFLAAFLALALGYSRALLGAFTALNLLALFGCPEQGRVALGVLTLRVAAHHECLVVGELDLNVLGRDTGQLTRKGVLLVALGDVELG